MSTSNVEEMLESLTRGSVYTVSRRLDGEQVFRQCRYYGFDLGKHVFKTVDDDDGEFPSYPPKVICVTPQALAKRVSPEWKEYNASRAAKMAAEAGRQ
jgi:transposase